MDVTGKAHNPENSIFVPEFLDVLRRNPSLFQLPETSKLQVPVRSNRTGDKLTDDYIMEDMVIMMLAACCDWYKLLSQVAEDMSVAGRPTHQLVIFGMNDSVPLSPFNKKRLRISKTIAHPFIEEALSLTREKEIPTTPLEFPDSAIAVVGLSCRFPGASNLSELWDLISQGKDTHKMLPKDRIDPDGSFRASQDASMSQRNFFGNFLDDIKRFDNSFFGINAKEAAALDPQQRLLLELSYEALESSGYLLTHTRGDSVGCFIGNSLNEYVENTGSHPPSAYSSTGTIRAFLCGRLSHYYGWTAPAEVIDTACSSSLVAVNRACRSIQSGECSMAIAGGVSALTGLTNFLELGKAGFLSPTGQCKPFDAGADGYCRGEGGGLVVLKRLSDAISAGNHIFGVIPSVATNQGGMSTTLTVPSQAALVSLYERVLQQASIQPSQISYVEAHGTGTQAGDPIEMQSIRSVFGNASRSSPLSIGSIKGNIGHCESAAGVAGLLKVLAMIEYGGIPPLANYNQLNPNIQPIEPDCMEITKALKNWQLPLRAALVNSYGAAGSNCALVCCEMPPKQVSNKGSQRSLKEWRHPLPILLSAASRPALAACAKSLAIYLQRNTSKVHLPDVAFTLNRSRKPQRFCLETSTAKLKDLDSIEAANFEYPSQPKPVVFVLSGQYDSKIALSHTIHDRYPAFQSYINICDSILVDLGYQSIQSAIFQTTLIPSALLLQCSIFAVQYACASCWIDSGLKPDVIIGHSLGELVALAISGTLSLKDCLKLVAYRARLIDSRWGPEKGVMLVIHSNSNVVQKICSRLGSRLEIACYNASSSIVTVGTAATVDSAIQILSTDKEFASIKFQRLSTTHAFHSIFTEPILSDLQAEALNLKWQNPTIPLETCTPGPVSLSYAQDWTPSRHAREPVYFVDAVQRVEQRLGSCLWLEIGMNSPVINMTMRACSDINKHTFQSLRTDTDEKSFDSLSTIVSELWRCGISVTHWAFLDANHQFKQVWLPPYQFQGQSHWLENIDRVMEAHQKLSTIDLPILEPEVERSYLLALKSGSSISQGLVTEFSINSRSVRFQEVVKGHAVLQQPLCPAPLYMECVVMAVQLLTHDLKTHDLSFKKLEFQSPLGSDVEREIDLVVEELARRKSWRFTVRSKLRNSKSEAQVHCIGTVSLPSDITLSTYGRLVEAAITRLQSCDTAERLMGKRAYGLFTKVMHYAPFFQGISSIIFNKSEALATVKLPANQPARDESLAWQRFDAVLLDSFISVVGLLLNSSDAVSDEEILIAMGIDHIDLTPACQSDLSTEWLIYAKFMPDERTAPIGDVFVYTPESKLVAVISGVKFARVKISSLRKSLLSANASNGPGASEASGEKPFRGADFPLSRVKHNNEHLTADTDSTDTPGDPTPSSETVTSRVKEIISNYTGLDPDDIPYDKVLVELGIDSLSTIEFIADIRADFGIELQTKEFSSLTLSELNQRLVGVISDITSERVAISDNAGEIALDDLVSPIAASDAAYDSSNAAPASPRIVAEGSSSNTSSGYATSGNPLEALFETDQHFEAAAKERGYSSYHLNVAPIQNNLVLAYILEAFKTLGLDLLSMSAGSIVPRLSYVSKHEKLVDRLWNILQARGLITKQASVKIRSREKFAIEHSDDIYSSFISLFPSYLPEANLMKLAGQNLARCLRGEQDPLLLLFGSPESFKVMESYYKDSPMVSTMTDQLVRFVRALTQRMQKDRSKAPRILEVGAGTGGTTLRLADSLQESGIECYYTFTDVSASLVSKARNKLRKYTWMSFDTFDLEKEVQDKFRNQFDIVIGTNCVHATTDKTASCRRIYEALADDGVVILSEGTEALDWFDICFGLLDGWWVAKDVTHPIQPASKWMETLQTAGFRSTGFSSGQTPEAVTQQLLVGCKRDGLVMIHSNPSSSRDHSDSYRLETMVYSEVSSVKIHADVYVPLQSRAEPMPVGMLSAITYLDFITNVINSTHDPWRGLYDAITKRHTPSTDKIPPIEWVPSC